MAIGRGGRAPTPGRAHDVVAAEEIRLDLVGQGVDREVHGGGEGFGTGGPTMEDVDKRLEVAAVLLVHSLGIDLLHGEGVACDREGNVAVGACGRVVAD